MELETLTVPGVYFLSRQIIITYYVQELQALLIPVARYFRGREVLQHLGTESQAKLTGVSGCVPIAEPIS